MNPDFALSELLDFLVPVTSFIKGDRNFPGGPVVQTLSFHFRGMGLIPGQGTKIPHAMRCSKKNPTHMGIITFS